MNKKYLTLVLVVLAQIPAYANDSGAISVDISGLRNDKGVLRLEVFNDESKFDAMKHTNSGALRAVVVPIQSGHAHALLSGLPIGEYAIRFFHDEDNSGKFYTNIIGIPKVEYGFSNNARGQFGPAKYKDAKFSTRAGENHMDLVAGHGSNY